MMITNLSFYICSYGGGSLEPNQPLLPKYVNKNEFYKWHYYLHIIKL